MRRSVSRLCSQPWEAEPRRWACWDHGDPGTQQPQKCPGETYVGWGSAPAQRKFLLSGLEPVTPNHAAVGLSRGGPWGAHMEIGLLGPQGCPVQCPHRVSEMELGGCQSRRTPSPSA